MQRPCRLLGVSGHFKKSSSPARRQLVAALFAFAAPGVPMVGVAPMDSVQQTLRKRAYCKALEGYCTSVLEMAALNVAAVQLAALPVRP